MALVVCPGYFLVGANAVRNVKKYLIFEKLENLIEKQTASVHVRASYGSIICAGTFGLY